MSMLTVNDIYVHGIVTYGRYRYECPCGAIFKSVETALKCKKCNFTDAICVPLDYDWKMANPDNWPLSDTPVLRGYDDVYSFFELDNLGMD